MNRKAENGLQCALGILILAGALVISSFARAQVGTNLGEDLIRSLRGTLVQIDHRHRMIKVQQEFHKHWRIFYVLNGRIGHLQVGDEIRVYYYPGSREALGVQKMTPLEYRKEDQNKGYLLRNK